MSTAPKLNTQSNPRNLPGHYRTGASPAGGHRGAYGLRQIHAWAVALARKLRRRGPVACDSTQVYRGFDIGTAKPSLVERDGVPHHLLDLVEPSFTFTAGEYRTSAIGGA
jgi:hypothetical protein